ncbi:MAG: DUF2442 domain-containing protein [Actinomycetota bacterium]
MEAVTVASVSGRRLKSRWNMHTLPVLIKAEYRGGYSIHLTFHDGTESTVNFEQWLDGPVFEPLHNVEEFKRFFVDAGSLSWPNGADIAPETLYESAAATYLRMQTKKGERC